MSSNFLQVRELLPPLEAVLRRCTGSPDSRSAVQLVYGLRELSATQVEVRGLVDAVIQILKRCNQPLGARQVEMLFSGMASLGSSHTTPELLKVIIRLADSCEEHFTAAFVSKIASAMRHLSSNVSQVRELLLIVRKIIEWCIEELHTPEAARLVFGLQSLSSEHSEVIDLVAAVVRLLDVCHFENSTVAQVAAMCMSGVRSAFALIF